MLTSEWRSGLARSRAGSAIVPVALLTSLAVGVSSLFMRPGYDEYYWLAIARKVAHGGTLYVNAIDNKPPPVYALTWLLDTVPGSYVLARSVMIALLVGAVVLLTYRLASVESNGLRSLIAATAGLTLALQSQLVYTTELVAVVLLLVGAVLASERRGLAAVAVACAAALFDPRSLLMLPGIVALVWRRTDSGGRSRAIATALLLTAAGIGVVVAVPSLHFALLELNAASRPSPTVALFGRSLLALVRDSLPLLLLWYGLRRRKISPHLTVAGWLLLVGAVLIGFVSVLPIDHYWSYLVVVLPFAWAPTGGDKVRLKPLLLLVACSLVPLVAMSVASGVRRAATENHNLAIASTLRGIAGPYVALDNQPYLPAMLPERNLLRSPTLRYLVWQSSREEQFRRELPGLLGAADVIVEDGILEASSDAIPQPYRYIREDALGELVNLPCSEVVADTTLHFRCDAVSP